MYALEMSSIKKSFPRSPRAQRGKYEDKAR